MANEREIAELIKKYEAFVTLYDIRYDDLLARCELDVERGKLSADIRYLVDCYNAKVGESEKWKEKYASRADHYNRAKYTAGADSFSERIERKYAESAGNMYSASVGDAQRIGEKITELENKRAALDKKRTALEESLKNGTLKYNDLAFGIADALCNEYPYDPAGYLYKADFYLRECLWQEEMVSYGRKKYASQPDLLDALNVYAQEIDRTANVREERGKAEKFLDGASRAAYAALIEKIDGFLGAGAKKKPAAKTGSAAKSGQSAAKAGSAAAKSGGTAKTSAPKPSGLQPPKPTGDKKKDKEAQKLYRYRERQWKKHEREMARLGRAEVRWDKESAKEAQNARRREEGERRAALDSSVSSSESRRAKEEERRSKWKYVLLTAGVIAVGVAIILLVWKLLV